MTSEFERGVRAAAKWVSKAYGGQEAATAMLIALLPPAAPAGDREMDDRDLVARVLRGRVEHLPDDVAEKICFEVSDEILAALAKAGRLASEVKGDVLLKAYDEAVEVYAGISGEIESDALHAAVVAASGIVAADAERRVQELLHMLELVKSVLDENRFVGDNNPLGIRDIVGAAIHHKGTRKCSTP